MLNEQKTVLPTSSGGSGDTDAASGLDQNVIPGTLVQCWCIINQGASKVADGKAYWWYERHVDTTGR